MGYVYICECQGYYKVGSAGDPKARIKDMQIGNPFPVTLVHSIGVSNPVVLERVLHIRLQRWRKSGEWFAIPPDVLIQLKAMDLENAERMVNERTPMVTAEFPVAISEGFSLEDHIKEVERNFLIAAMMKAHGSHAAAAGLLGMTVRQVRHLLSRHELRGQQIRWL